MKTSLIILSTLLSFAASAQNTDLVLNGERWEAKSTGYTCGAFAGESDAPVSHQELDVKFEVLRTDRTLDNGLVLGSFKVGTATCRYSAILLADNAASTIDLVESRAYSLTENVDCMAGKNILDANLQANEYLYWGHPHHVTIMMPDSSAEEVCGAGATHIGLDFTVSRRISK